MNLVKNANASKSPCQLSKNSSKKTGAKTDRYNNDENVKMSEYSNDKSNISVAKTENSRYENKSQINYDIDFKDNLNDHLLNNVSNKSNFSDFRVQNSGSNKQILLPKEYQN